MTKICRVCLTQLFLEPNHMNKKYLALIVGLSTTAATISGAALATTVSAAAPTTSTAQSVRGQTGMHGHSPGVFGIVSAINGNSITVTSKQFNRGATATSVTYTVDASSATVTKAGAASAVSNIAVGDTIMIQGTVNGTTVTAKVIYDGILNGMPSTNGQHRMNGQKPGVFGTVSAINGNSITITSKQFSKGATAATATTVTYTVDASGATVTKAGATSSVSNIMVGDTLMVQGTVSGTTVTAKTIRDGVMGRTSGTRSATNGQHPGVFGTVAAINGDSLTVTSKQFNKGATATTVTYTVDASNATVTKTGAASTVSNILVGDKVMVQGTVNGTTVTAKTIRDGAPRFHTPVSR